jgi:hypothetical protein
MSGQMKNELKQRMTARFRRADSSRPAQTKLGPQFRVKQALLNRNLIAGLDQISAQIPFDLIGQVKR